MQHLWYQLTMLRPRIRLLPASSVVAFSGTVIAGPPPELRMAFTCRTTESNTINDVRLSNYCEGEICKPAAAMSTTAKLRRKSIKQAAR